MLQVVKAAAKDLKDNTQFYLIFANKSEDDILLRKELEVRVARGILMVHERGVSPNASVELK